MTLVVQNQALPPSDHEIMVYKTMADNAVASNFYKGVGGSPAVMMVMLTARELGIPPMQALNGGINIIQGKPEIAARMMSAMIRRAGHDLDVVEGNEKICTIKGTRKDTGKSRTVSYSIEQAQKAGLVKPGGGWTKHPEDMLFARALSRLARQHFSDIIGMGYVEGEIRDSTSFSPDMPVIPSEPEIIEDDTQIVQDFLEIFDKEERFLALEYLEHVMNHFKWTRTQTVSEFLKDKKKLFEKFNTWKKKHQLSVLKESETSSV